MPLANIVGNYRLIDSSTLFTLNFFVRGITARFLVQEAYDCDITDFYFGKREIDVQLHMFVYSPEFPNRQYLIKVIATYSQIMGVNINSHATLSRAINNDNLRQFVQFLEEQSKQIEEEFEAGQLLELCNYMNDNNHYMELVNQAII